MLVGSAYGSLRMVSDFGSPPPTGFGYDASHFYWHLQMAVQFPTVVVKRLIGVRLMVSVHGPHWCVGACARWRGGPWRPHHALTMVYSFRPRERKARKEHKRERESPRLR